MVQTAEGGRLRARRSDEVDDGVHLVVAAHRRRRDDLVDVGGVVPLDDVIGAERRRLLQSRRVDVSADDVDVLVAEDALHQQRCPRADAARADDEQVRAAAHAHGALKVRPRFRDARERGEAAARQQARDLRRDGFAHAHE